MPVSFDRIVISVPSLDAAIAQYATLFGEAPKRVRHENEEPAAWLALSNTVIELVERPGSDPSVAGLVLADEGAGAGLQNVPNSLELAVSVGNGQQTASFREEYTAPALILAVDHVVLRTKNADACIELFRDTLGIRLALDKMAPQWGGRMLFFRAGKMTLEVIATDKTEGEEQEISFWGIAFQCPDLLSLHDNLAGEGVALSEIRDGRKAGTQVATLKSHSLGIPTLLLQPSAV